MNAVLGTWTTRMCPITMTILIDLGYEPADDETEHLETLRQTIKQEDGEAGREDREDDE